MELHARILGASPRSAAPLFPADFSDIKNFFVGQEHIMGELRDILSLRKFDEGAKNSKVLVLVFAGVSGTGKTMLAELIANVIHGKSIDDLKAEGKFFQQDMGSWQNPEDSDSLFGVKQGIVGEAKLVDLIEKNPNIVVCLDEFSRAHEANRNAFFSAFQSHVQDKKSGKVVKTDRVTFILTTNTGQDALLERSGVLEDPPRWNSRHNRSLPEVESVIQSAMEEFRRDDPVFKDSAFRSRIREIFTFLPYSFEMRLEILNMTIARDVRTWGGCISLASGCHCYGCIQAPDECECEDSMKKISTSMVAFSHRAKLQLLAQLSRQAAMQKEYPNTRSMKVLVDQHKIIVMNFIERCELLEGDGLIIDYERDQFQGKVVPNELTAERSALHEACLLKRAKTPQSNNYSVSSSPSLDSVPEQSASAPTSPAAIRKANDAASVHVERDIEKDVHAEREIQQRINDAVTEIMIQQKADHEARIKAAEDSARIREISQAASHARDMKFLEDQLIAVKAELANWKQYFYMVAAALAVSLAVLIAVLFKVLAAPIVLAFVIGSFILLLFLFPNIFWSLLEFLKWIWQNPVFGGLSVIVIISVLYNRKRILKRVFGGTTVFETLPDLRCKIKALEADAKNYIIQIKSLEDCIQVREKEIKDLQALVSSMTPQGAGGGSSAGQLLSPSPALVQTTSTPDNVATSLSDTPARGISP